MDMNLLIQLIMLIIVFEIIKYIKKIAAPIVPNATAI